jgi:hypothetical protein
MTSPLEDGEEVPERAELVIRYTKNNAPLGHDEETNKDG